MGLDYRLSKSDYLLYRDSPMHLWAKVRNKITQLPSVLELDRMQQGYEVEKLAGQYLVEHLPSPGDGVTFQVTVSDGTYLSRLDALVHREDGTGFDLYEIKSATSLDKDHIEDCAYQYLVAKPTLDIKRVFLLHLNKTYIRQDDLDLNQLFIAEEITDEVLKQSEFVRSERQIALEVALADQPDPHWVCYSPKSCPCPEVCHPDLPGFSIYNIPRLSIKNKLALRSQGILSAAQIPQAISLTDEQARVVHTARSGTPFIDHGKLSQELNTLKFPLSFLDYETYNCAIPLYANYHPQQQMVVQYSLHTLDEPGGMLTHSEYLCLADVSPALSLLQNLRQDLKPSGSVLVWNQSFEMSRNREMAEIHPEFTDFLTDLNERVIDLADFVHYGSYVHPDFRGSWSIKNVLPVMVPDLTYDGLAIHDGGEATIAWWKLVHTRDDSLDAEQVRKDLLAYCEMDTLAMVKIYEQLIKIAQE